MNIPENLRYTKTHEWVLPVGPDAVRVGLTDFAQHKLVNLVFANLPEAGAPVTAGESFADVESVKAVSEVFSPVTGIVTAVNEALLDAPQGINEHPYEAWLAEIGVITRREELLDAAAYAAFCETEEA